jgi:hypothetical protein
MNKTYTARVVDDAVVITVEESLGMGRYKHVVLEPIPIHEWDDMTYQVDMILNRDKPSLICGEHKLP